MSAVGIRTIMRVAVSKGLIKNATAKYAITASAMYSTYLCSSSVRLITA